MGAVPTAAAADDALVLSGADAETATGALGMLSTAVSGAAGPGIGPVSTSHAPTATEECIAGSIGTSSVAAAAADEPGRGSGPTSTSCTALCGAARPSAGPLGTTTSAVAGAAGPKAGPMGTSAAATEASSCIAAAMAGTGCRNSSGAPDVKESKEKKGPFASGSRGNGDSSGGRGHGVSRQSSTRARHTHEGSTRELMARRHREQNGPCLQSGTKMGRCMTCA